MVPRDGWPEIIDVYDGFVDTLPDEATSGLLLGTAPDPELLPDERQHHTGVVERRRMRVHVIETGRVVFREAFVNEPEPDG
jgi:hypothetical protein